MDKATYHNMELKDGSEVQLTLSFGRLYKLRQEYPEAYEKYNKIVMDGMKDEFHFITYLYYSYIN